MVLYFISFGVIDLDCLVGIIFDGLRIKTESRTRGQTGEGCMKHPDPGPKKPRLLKHGSLHKKKNKIMSAFGESRHVSQDNRTPPS